MTADHHAVDRRAHVDRGSLPGADQRRAALGAVELGARFAQLHLRLEALDLEADAALHHLVLAGEAFLGDAAP